MVEMKFSKLVPSGNYGKQGPLGTYFTAKFGLLLEKIGPSSFQSWKRSYFTCKIWAPEL